MLKIIFGKSEDIDAIYRVYGRCLSSNIEEKDSLPRLSKDELSDAIEWGKVFVYKDNAKVIGFVIEEENISNIFDGSCRKADDFLSSVDLLGKDVVALTHIFIDPMYQNKKHGKELLDFFLVKRKGYSILSPIGFGAFSSFPFFEKMGFVLNHKDNNRIIAVKSYIEEGLCRNIGW